MNIKIALKIERKINTIDCARDKISQSMIIALWNIAKTIEMRILILTEYHLFHMIALIKFNIVSGHFGSRCESGTVSQQP